MKDRVILVTGATSGIGRATALLFAEIGAKVVATSRTPRAGTELVQEIRNAGGDAAFVPCDVTDAKQVQAAVTFAVDHFDRLDFAFNNAGIFLPESILHDHTEDIWDQVIATNLSSIYHCMKAEIIAMHETTMNHNVDCVIVNNASIVGHRGSAASGLAYTTAKHGVIGLTRQVAVTYAGERLRVNAVSPGPTLTNATSAGLDLPPDERREKLLGLNPTGQLVDVDEIASTVAFLCSDAARMINGQDIALDGGQLAKL